MYYPGMAGIRLPEHSHCKYCGDPVPFGEEYCNDSCRAGDAESMQKQKKKDLMFYVVAGLTVVIILAVGYYI